MHGHPASRDTLPRARDARDGRRERKRDRIGEPARGRTLLAIVLVCVALSGCSAIRTVYNQADHVAAWRADDYFDLDDVQKRAFRTRFARLHAWHRTTQLRAYAEFLEAIHGRLGHGPQPQDVAWASGGFRDHYRLLAQEGAADAAALLSTLSDRQVARARERFDRDNRKFARERGIGKPVAEQRRMRASLDLESIEHWTGPLDRAQRARVVALSEALPADAELRLQDRERRQREFLALLEARHGAEFPDRLRAWLLDWDAQRPRAVDAELSRYGEARARSYLALFAELTPEQRARVLARVRWYADAMRELARGVGQQAAAQAAPAMP